MQIDWIIEEGWRSQMCFIWVWMSEEVSFKVTGVNESLKQKSKDLPNLS